MVEKTCSFRNFRVWNSTRKVNKIYKLHSLDRQRGRFEFNDTLTDLKCVNQVDALAKFRLNSINWHFAGIFHRNCEMIKRNKFLCAQSRVHFAKQAVELQLHGLDRIRFLGIQSGIGNLIHPKSTKFTFDRSIDPPSIRVRMDQMMNSRETCFQLPPLNLSSWTELHNGSRQYWIQFDVGGELVYSILVHSIAMINLVHLNYIVTNENINISLF